MAKPAEVREVQIGKGKVVGVHVRLPGEGANLLLIRADRGYVMCGYLNLALAEEVGDAAALVRGVGSIEDVLEAKIVDATSKAKAMGVKPGMAARQALVLMQGQS